MRKCDFQLFRLKHLPRSFDIMHAACLVEKHAESGIKSISYRDVCKGCPAGPGDADGDGPASKRQRLSGEAPSASRLAAESADMPTRQRVVAKLAAVRVSGRDTIAIRLFA